MSQEIKVDGTLVELSDDHKVIQICERETLLVIDHGLAFTILTGKRKQRAFAKMQKAPEVQIVVSAPAKDPPQAPPAPVEDSLAIVSLMDEAAALVETITTEEQATVENDILHAMESEPAQVEVTEAEEQAFIDSQQTIDENWEPDEHEYFDAKLVYANANRHFLFAELSNGQRVHILEKRATSGFGQHLFCLPIGTFLQVRIKRQPGHHDFTAVEAYVPGEPPAMHETGTIQRWRGNFGSIQRMCSGKCAIFGMTRKREEFLSLFVGDQVEFDLEMSTKKAGSWIAANVRAVESENKEEVHEDTEPPPKGGRIWRDV